MIEIYELDGAAKDNLEEICDLRQPLRFNYMSDNLFSLLNMKSLKNSYGAFDVKLRNVKKIDDEPYVPLSLNNAFKVLSKDKDEKFLVKTNQDF